MPQDMLAKLWTIGLMDTRAVPDIHCAVSPLPCSLSHPCHAISHPPLQDHTSLQGLSQVMGKVCMQMVETLQSRGYVATLELQTLGSTEKIWWWLQAKSQ